MPDTIFVLLGLKIIIPGALKQLLTAAILGLLMGVEREWRQKAASLRTFSFICTGSCLFTLLSVLGVGNATHDVTRIASNIVTGIGFVGGGVIFKTADRVEGISTASMIWMCAAIGMACGFGELWIAFSGLLIYILILSLARLMHQGLSDFRNKLQIESGPDDGEEETTHE